MFSEAYKRYALAAMTLVYALSLFDRGVMIMLLQPIKEDLLLSDTQLGFVTGIAFSLFYATLGVVIARWADRSNRVTITSLAIGLWGLTVMACLFVTNYVQLIFARIFAAVGESGANPPTYSLLGDYFPEPAERTRAMYVYQSAVPLTSLASFTLAGWLNDVYGWRLTFFLIGIPGLMLAILVKRTLVEPRNHVSRARHQAAPAPPMKAVLAILWKRPSCRHLTLAMMVFFTMGAGVGPWQAAFMMRSHGMGTTELGLWMGLTAGFGGIAGLLLGSYIISRWLPGNERGQMRLTAWALAAGVPCWVAFLMLPDRHLALIALIPQTILGNAVLPIPFALLQRLVPDEMRATVMVVMMLLANLVAMGIGPQLVGIVSDLLTPMLGSDGLRYAMLIASFLVIWAAYHFWKVGQAIDEDLLRIANCPSSIDRIVDDPCPNRAL